MKHGARAAIVAITVALAAVAGGCKDRRVDLDALRFDRLDVQPGFSIRLPAGARVTKTDRPAGGQILLAGPSLAMVVAWTNGRVPREDLPMFARATMGTLAAEIGDAKFDELPLELPAPDYGLEMDTATDKGARMVMTAVQCDHARVTVWLMSMASGDRDRARRFHERFRSTLRCRDDVEPLSTSVGLPAVEMGDDLGYVPGSDPPMYVSPRGGRWTVTIGDPSMKTVLDRPDMVARMFAGFGVEITKQETVAYRGHGDWTVRQLAGELDGDAAHLLLALLMCPSSTAYMVVYADVLAIGEVPELAALDRISCPKAPVDAAQLPTAAARFTAACDGGDSSACVVFALLIEEDRSLFPDQDPAKVRARACELGATGMCP